MIRVMLGNYDARKRTALRRSVRVRACQFFTLLAVVLFQLATGVL
jgi:hypothetical protein